MSATRAKASSLTLDLERRNGSGASGQRSRRQPAPLESEGRSLARARHPGLRAAGWNLPLRENVMSETTREIRPVSAVLMAPGRPMANSFRYRRGPIRASCWATFCLVPFCLFQTEAASAGSLDLTVHDAGIGIGDSRKIHGLRLNYRDRRLREVNGINVTLWSPYSRSRGVVRGLALGLPVTGAETLRGGGVGVLG